MPRKILVQVFWSSVNEIQLCEPLPWNKTRTLQLLERSVIFSKSENILLTYKIR